jgi:hypothetical protein
MPAKTHASNGFTSAAPVAVVEVVVEENKYITNKIPIIGTFIESHLQTNLCLLR